MFRALLGWIQHRTNFRGMFDALLLEHIPGGAKWRYVWGSCLSFVFAIQVLTGVLLMTAYSPGESSAWGSVYFIQYEMDFGWMIRGLHHFGSQMMVVLLFLHMLQVVIAGAHLPPREFNWWLGLLLMGIVLGLSLTGYLLPWDQKGYWATQVATKILGNTPLIGSWLQSIVVGGPDYGNATLTRFFAMHVAILPGILVVLLIAHLALFRRHGITYPGYPKKDRVGDEEGWFWPDQVFKDMVASLVVLGVMLFLIINGHGIAIERHGQPIGADEHFVAGEEQGFYEYWAKGGHHGMGVNLDAPADPAVQYDPRPEWYYLFLFQLLKYFEGEQEVIGTMVIPGGVAAILFILPLLGFGKMRRFGNIVSTIVVVALIASIVSLTCLALAQDTPEEIPHALLNRIGWPIVPLVAGVYLVYLAISAMARGGARYVVVPVGMTLVALLMIATGGLVYAALNNDVPEPVAELIRKKIAEEEKATKESTEKFTEALQKAKNFQEAVHKAHLHAERAIELAHPKLPGKGGNIPPEGAKFLLRHDPKTQFKRLFKNCATCHSYADERVVDFAKIPDLKPAFYINREKEYKEAKFSASDLAGFGTKEWIHSFLKNPGDNRFFGRILDEKGKPRFRKGMMRWVQEQCEEAEGKGKEAVNKLEEDFGKIAAWLASHPTGTDFKKPELQEGFLLFQNPKGYNCTGCHQYENLNKEAVSAPDLTGYGSQGWLHKMIRSPGHPELYGTKNIIFFEEEVKDKKGNVIKDQDGNPKTVSKTKSLMPSFMPAGNALADLQRKDFQFFLKKTLDVDKVDFEVLSDLDRELIVRYLTGDYRVVFGGQEVTGVEVKKKE